MSQIKGDLEKIVLETVSRITIKNEKDYDRPLRELGVDSLDMMSILLAILDKFQVEISDEDAKELTSLNLLVAHIENTLKKENVVK